MRVMSICAITMLAVCTSVSPAQSDSPDSPLFSRGDSLLISRGDSLHIIVADLPDMEQHARVTDSGDIPLQGATTVHVAGLTPAAAALAIRNVYVSTHYLNHPQLSVVVEQYATQNVTIIGEVKTPGSYQILTPRPILDVISLGGGLDPVADRHILIERHGDTSHPVHYNLSNDAQIAIQEQVLINPGDTVVVPRAGIVYVLGDVNRPGGYMMTDNQAKISLLEALAMAGGAAKTAKLGHARLLRKNDEKNLEISLGEVEKGKSPDIALLPGDILFVPFSYVKNLVVTGSSGIVGAASAAAIYASPAF